MNAELWCNPGNERNTLTSWLRSNNVKYNEEMTTEELRQLYIKRSTENVNLG